jgi:hypothetical protein
MADQPLPGGRLIIRYGPNDTGVREVPATIAVWDGPNVRVVNVKDTTKISQYRDPHNDIWNQGADGNTVDENEYYQVVVRAANLGSIVNPTPGTPNEPTDHKDVWVEAWVYGFNAGAPVPLNESPLSGNDYGPFTPGTDFVLMTSGTPWQPTADDVAKYNAHVCVQANIYAKETLGGDGAAGTPADGQQSGGTIFPFRDTHHAQRNLTIIPAPHGVTVTRNLLLAVAATDRCPLEANVAVREAELPDDPAALRRLVGDFGDLKLRTACGDPLDKITIDAGDGCPADDIDLELQPGDSKLLKITIPHYEDQRVGDVYGFDIATTYNDGAKVYGGARFYVVVTPGLGV